jgi:hypothetical protein
MGTAIALAGLVFVFGLGWAGWRALETRQWPQVEGTVKSVGIETQRATFSSPVTFVVRVKYEYLAEGQTRMSDRLKRRQGPTSDLEKAQATKQQFVPGQKVTVWFNPADPSYAVLRHESLGALYSIWFPMLFVVGGGVMAWRAWRGGSAPC